MAVFHVSIEGSGLLLSFDGGEPALHGFFKNEYVWARSERDAERKAMARVLNRAKSQFELDREALERLRLQADEIGPSSLWTLLRREGFILYPEDEEDCPSGSGQSCS